MRNTFNNLPKDKRERFTQQALIEFSQHSFETASINQIIKSLGIARGSVYQYFEDKVDLWLYLKEYSENKKMEYAQSVKRDDFNDFWEYYRALYQKGIDYDREQPYCSKFLYRVGFRENSEKVSQYLDDWKEKAHQALSIMVESEKSLGSFDNSIATEAIVHFLITMGYSITEFVLNTNEKGIEKNMKNKTGLLDGHEKNFEKAVSDLILLLQKALRP